MGLKSVYGLITNPLTGFRERLAASDFNKSQGAMLQLRLDLLHSFLQGTGNDVSSFFKSGRLIIIDLSDPFIDGESILSWCNTHF